MRKCKQIKKYMVPYLNGELGRRRHSKIERHLEKCPGCIHEYQLEKRMENLLSSEMRNAAHESDPLLTWDNLRQSLEREAIAAKRESRWRQIVEGWRTSITETTLPKAMRAFSETAYWGKKVSVPAVIVLLVFFSYHAFQTSTYSPEPASKTTRARHLAIVRINFGPEGSAIPARYYADAGGVYRPYPGSKNGKFGWRKTNGG